jgi:hypothetical protein
VLNPRCSGYFLTVNTLSNYPIATMRAICQKRFYSTIVNVTFTRPDNSTRTTRVPNGIFVHEAWHIAWNEDDRSTLSPSLPALTGTKEIYSWHPAQTVPPGWEGDDPGEAAATLGPIFRFLMIGVPLITVTCFACCVWCFVAGRRRERRRRRAREEELASRRQNGHAVAGGNPEVSNAQ